MQREFRYMLKLWTGRLVYAKGTDAEAAMRAAGVKPDKVKRHMPVKALQPEAEIEAKAAAQATRLTQRLTQGKVVIRLNSGPGEET